jgi:hypothetical protein
VIRIANHLGAFADHAPVGQVVIRPDIDAAAELVLDLVAKRLAGLFESDDALGGVRLAAILRRLVVWRIGNTIARNLSAMISTDGWQISAAYKQ